VSRDQFLTIKGRWARCVAASGLDKILSRREQALAMMCFYSGFSACIEANVEMAELPDDQVAQLIAALQLKVHQVEAMATQIFSGRPMS
jgi:hypothetical protein